MQRETGIKCHFRTYLPEWLVWKVSVELCSVLRRICVSVNWHAWLGNESDRCKCNGRLRVAKIRIAMRTPPLRTLLEEHLMSFDLHACQKTVLCDLGVFEWRNAPNELCPAAWERALAPACSYLGMTRNF